MNVVTLAVPERLQFAAKFTYGRLQGKLYAEIKTGKNLTKIGVVFSYWIISEVKSRSLPKGIGTKVKKCDVCRCLEGTRRTWKNVELSTTPCKAGNFCSGLMSCLSKNISWCNFYWNRKNLFEDNRYCTYGIPWEKNFLSLKNLFLINYTASTNI